MLAQYICTTNIEQSIDFYTKVVGLRYVPPQLGSEEYARLEAGAPMTREGEVLVIRDETICLASPRVASRIRRTRMRRVPGSLGQDMYFLSRHPLDYVRARVQAAGWQVLEGPVARKGNTHTLRTLYLLDPDGNRIRLVELSA